MSGAIQPPERSGPHNGAAGAVTIPYEELAGLIEDFLIPPDAFEAALIAVADKSYDAANEDALIAVRMADAVLARIGDADADLRAAKWRRLFTTRHIRKVVEETEAAPPPATGRSKRKKAAQVSTVIVSIYLLASIFLMNFTIAQTILAERVFPAVGHSLWRAQLVSGVLLSGMLLVPLSLSWIIGSSRLRMLFLVIVNVLAMTCSVLFLDDLWRLHTLTALHAHSVFSGTDLTALADGKLEITRLKGALMILAICGEALGALAVKLNLDHLRGLHHKYRFVTNPDRVMAEQEVAAARAELTRLQTEYETLVEQDKRLTLSRQQHRVACRLFVEAARKDIAAMVAVGIRAVHRQVRRNPRGFA